MFICHVLYAKIFSTKHCSLWAIKPLFHHFEINYKLTVSFSCCINYLSHPIWCFDTTIILKNEKFNFMTSFICKKRFAWFDLFLNIVVISEIECRLVIRTILKSNFFVFSICILWRWYNAFDILIASMI